MKKTLALCLLFFVFGFLTHAIFFPEILSNGFEDISRIALPNTNQPETENQAFETKITFDGEKFSKHSITIEVGSYLIITNISTQGMWLNSNNPQLSTPRSYGESETIRVRMDEKGQFVVADKNNPKERFAVTVK